MKISVIGTGYVGLVSGTCFAEIGHDVTCIDSDENKIALLQEGQTIIYEAGLSELLVRNIEAGRLSFSSQHQSIKSSQIVFIAVGTPSLKNGSCDLSYIRNAIKDIADKIEEGTVIAIKSTVPVGTCDEVRTLLKKHTKKKFHLVNNPEFLREGTAVKDFMHPDRVIIGHDSKEAASLVQELYAPLVKQGNPILTMSNLSAEVSKYASNCYLATRISFINEVARFCDKVGADIEEVRKGLAADERIGGHFLYPGPGYGGSCFPKDVKAFIQTAKEKGVELRIVEATEKVNKEQKVFICQKIARHFDNNLKDKKFAFWGTAFKANTDDVRESPAIYIAKELISKGAKIQFYDPEAGNNFLDVMGEEKEIRAFPDRYSVLEGCNGLITVTEWREFHSPDFSQIKKLLKNPIIFDARNLFDTTKVLKAGFTYYALGKKI